MATNIGKLAVTLSADTRGFATGMSSAATFVGRVRQAVGRATDTVRTFEAAAASAKDFRLAGTDTIDAFRTTLAVARGELRRFGRNRDVRVALEVGREHLDESWIAARARLQGLARRAGITVAAKVAADKAADLRGWIDRQRRAVAKPIVARVELARRALDGGLASARQSLDALRRFRAVRIAIAAADATKLPVQAALATLGPMRRLAAAGVVVALRASHHGVALGVTKARSILANFASTAGAALAPLAVAGGTLTAGIGGLGVYAVKLAADAERAKVAFGTLLGSADAAKAMLAEINAFATATPFQTPELIDASKKLLAFGVAQDQVIPTMRTLGDLAAGLDVPLGDLAELYGKARVQGRLYMEDVNQLTGRGIPVIQEFAKQFNVSEAEVRGLVESGQIGFPQLQKALVSLTGEGGKFGGMMAAQSRTVSGLFSTMQDAAVMSLTRIGKAITDGLDLRAAIAGVNAAVGALSDAALPVIEAFIGRMAEGGNIGQRAGELVLGGAEMIATGLAYAIDYSKLLVVGFKGMQAGAALAIGGLLKAVDHLGSGLVTLLNYLPGVELQWTDTIGAMADGVLDESSRLADEAAGAWDDFNNSDSAAAVGRFFDGVRDKAAAAAAGASASGDAIAATMKIADEQAANAAAIRTAMDALRADAAEIGMGDGADEVAKLAKLGATERQIADAKELVGLQDRLKAMGKVEGRDPFGDFSGKVGELQALAAQGKVTAGQLEAIRGSAVLSLADNVKISGDDALGQYAAAMQQLQALYAAGKVTADQFATIRASAQTGLNDTLADQAKDLTDGLRTPLESYQSEVARLTEMFERGLIDQATLDKATVKARETLTNAGGGGNPDKGVTAIRAGSQEAARLAYDNARGPQRITGQAEYAKAQLKEAERQTKTLDTIARNTAAGTGGPTLEEVTL